MGTKLPPEDRKYLPRALSDPAELGIGNSNRTATVVGEPSIERLGSARARCKPASRGGATWADVGTRPPFGTIPGDVWRGA